MYPKELQGAYFALKAFSVEIAMVSDTVSNPTIGMMRMQFWRDAVKGISDGNPPRHPIALALHDASQRTGLPPYHLKRMIDARNAELQVPVHLTTESLVAHAESTSSTLLYSLLSMLSLHSDTYSHAASHLGVAQTISTLLRGLPFHARHGRMIIPAEITAKHGVVQEEVFRKGKEARGIDDAVFEFATLANDHLITARSMFNEEGLKGKIPQEAMAVFLAGVPVSNILTTLEKLNFDVFHPKLQIRDWRLPWKIWRSYYKHEVLQLIFYELHEPSSLILASKRFYEFSQDPYFRARYFIARYGSGQAMFHALGRGKVLSERVLDILITSGAHFSRYLIQVAIHHYFHTQSHFIKSQWVRSVPLPVFTHFLQLASNRYDDIPRGKGQDDGSIFALFLNESRYPPSQKRVSWETIRDIIEKYNFFPFSNKDPIMAQFPLALAIEPRLLPYAVANGFYMDSKYRDFVFRKMFEYASASDRKAEDIVQNFTELTRLDSTMFLTRTVAAEICMEAKINTVGYSALKQLDKKGCLRFSLATLVKDLLKLFLKTRSVTTLESQSTIRHLFAEFPSSDSTVRLVVLLTVFMAADTDSLPTVKVRLEDLKIGPLTRRDIYNLLIHPMMDRCTTIFDYMRSEMESLDLGRKGLNSQEIRQIVDDVATRLIEIDCKGRMLRRLNDSCPTVRDTVMRVVLAKYSIDFRDLPESTDFDSCATFQAALCRDHSFKTSELEYFWNQIAENDTEEQVNGMTEGMDERELGEIGQDSLTIMIRQDELLPSRSRRRISYFSSFTDLGLSILPIEYDQVGRWIKSEFGATSSIAAVFMTHAVVNNSSSILRHYLLEVDSPHVPLTFKHFELLARLGRPINYTLTLFLLSGPEFYQSEDDYITSCDAMKRTMTISETKGYFHEAHAVTVEPHHGSSRGRKRLRRSAAHVRTYALPESDEETIRIEEVKKPDLKDVKQVMNLDKWIQELGTLLKAEQSKLRQRRKQTERLQTGVTNPDTVHNDFVKSLAAELRLLRKHSREKASHNEIASYDDEDDDGEYIERAGRYKRTRTTR
ncbi:hypothetical protein V5O48_002857 [Marasmius crinis-equi]|uniref:Uncharacterized protein n=1 Tax=Marasmius crinis-equi TaxID=585013 RepID=A0ABR3FV71_9AGAR